MKGLLASKMKSKKELNKVYKHWNSCFCKESQGRTRTNKDRQGQTKKDKDKQGQEYRDRDRKRQVRTSSDGKGMSLFVPACPCLNKIKLIKTYKKK